MSAHSRLHTALSDGLLTLPDGAVTVMRPPATFDLAPLDGRDVHIAQGFYPDYAAWQAAGYDVSATAKQAATVIVVLPRSKALARDMIAQACALGQRIVIDGFKTDGVESVFKACRKALGDLPSVSKAHGRLFWFDSSDAFADWTAASRQIDGFTVQPGVFSDGGIDKGSALLAAALPAKLPKRIADLGAGWGYLSDAILARDGVQHLEVVEAEVLALDCARQNITDARAAFHWTDATQFVPADAVDAVIMNPPFHTSRASDPSLGRTFIQAAARMMTTQGKLWMVANRHLPYEGTLRDTFRHVDELPGSGAFKIFHASRPLRVG